MSCECKNTNPVNHDSCHCNTFISPACGAPQHHQPQVDMTYYMHLISANQFLNLEVQGLKEELCLCAQENSKLKKENKKLQDEIEELKEKIADLEKEIAALKDELAKSTNCDTVTRLLAEANKNLLEKAGKLDKLKQAIQNAKNYDDTKEIQDKIATKTFDSPAMQLPS